MQKILKEGRERVRTRISVFLASDPRISKISIATRTPILDKELFFRLDDLTITFHLINKYPQSFKIVLHKKRNINNIFDKAKEQRSQPKNVVSLHLTETSSSVATTIEIVDFSLTRSQIDNDRHYISLHIGIHLKHYWTLLLKKIFMRPSYNNV